MRWLRLVGSLTLQVSFAKETYKRDDILQKRPMILRGRLMVATPQRERERERGVYRERKIERERVRESERKIRMCLPLCTHLSLSIPLSIDLFLCTLFLQRKIRMGWLRVVGSLKLQVSFAEYRLFSWAPLHQRRIILRSLIIVATPYVYVFTQRSERDVHMQCVSVRLRKSPGKRKKINNERSWVSRPLHKCVGHSYTHVYTHKHVGIFVYIYIYICIYFCVCVCRSHMLQAHITLLCIGWRRCRG